jgi:hypothetical protein
MSTNIFGNAPNQVPTNADLGGMAYQDPRFVVVAGGNVNPTNFSTSNAQILAGNITGIHNLAATAGNITTLVADNLAATAGNITTLVADNFSAANINMTGTTVTSGTVQITNATDSVGPTSGALRITGGAGILGNLHVGGNLFVTGNTFSLSTEDLRVEDSIIELHTFANLAPLTANDGRDIGIKMHYFDTQDSHAFLGRVNNSGYLEWYDRGIEGFGNVFQGNTYGTFKAGEVILANTTAATSTTTGALRISGGVGVSAGMYVSGTSWFQNTSFSNISLVGGSATTLVATNFSTGNAVITSGTATTLVATNFSSANIYQTGTQSIQTSNVAILGGNIGMDYNKTVTPIGNLYTTIAHAVNLSSGNVAVNGNIVVGPSGASGTGSAAPFGNLIITGNAYINNGSQDLTANAIATRGYVDTIGIIFGV